MGALKRQLPTVVDKSASALATDLPASFAEPIWDYLPPSTLETVKTELFARQVRFAMQHVPFWQRRLEPYVKATTTVDRGVRESLPLLHKSQARALGPFDLLPTAGGPFHMVRGTGGTTGSPVPVTWSHGDWRAAIEAIVRYLDPIKAIAPKVVWNGYNQSHSAGPSFDDVARALGATPVPRHFKSSDAQALEEIARFQARVLVITPRSGSGKGGSLEDLLAIDASFLSRLGIKGLLCSSTPLDADLLAEVRDQGVTSVVNLYGSTEAFPDAITCDADHTAFHLVFGPNFVEVVHPDGRHVAHGERGLVVVSRLGSSDGQSVGPATGIQLFRLVVGDEATFLAEPCRCGRTAPRITGIVRATNLEDKVIGGCEKWE